MREFVLDLRDYIDALDRCENADDDSDEWGEPAGAVLDELSRQLAAAGAPPGDLEQQLRSLLARPALVESGADMMAALALTFDQAADAFEEQDTSQRGNSTLSGIRAVLSCLASMGAEALPSVRDIGRAVSKIEPWENYSEGHLYERRGQAIHDIIAPLLAAKDARIRELEAQLAARPIGIPYPPPPPPPPSVVAEPPCSSCRGPYPYHAPGCFRTCR